MSVPESRREEFRNVAVTANRKLETAEPREVLEWAYRTFGAKAAIASSMTDTILIDLACQVTQPVDVVFLDTGYHFSETLETRAAVEERYDLRLHNVTPRQTVAEQDTMFGPDLFGRDSDACCTLRKVEPLRRALEPFHAWMSGIRRDESPTRATIGIVEWDEARSLVKVNPLARWTSKQVEAYCDERALVMNPLLSQGYPSVGCKPCTRQVLDGEDVRSGRWAGREKTECGLHVGPDGRLGPMPPVPPPSGA